jgi:hypothetical protein
MVPMTSEDPASTAGRPPQHEIDPVISDAVHTVENRFGAPGLRDLIDLAQQELARAEAALRELSDL